MLANCEGSGMRFDGHVDLSSSPCSSFPPQALTLPIVFVHSPSCCFFCPSHQCKIWLTKKPRNNNHNSSRRKLVVGDKMSPDADDWAAVSEDHDQEVDEELNVMMDAVNYDVDVSMMLSNSGGGCGIFGGYIGTHGYGGPGKSRKHGGSVNNNMMKVAGGDI